MSNVILLASTVLIVISIFIVALRCDLAYPWIFIDAQCPGLVRAFGFIILALLTYRLVHSLAGGSCIRHPYRTSSFFHRDLYCPRPPIVPRKEVCGHSSLRAPSSVSRGYDLFIMNLKVDCVFMKFRVIVTTVVRLYYLSEEFSSSDPTLDGVLASVCTQIEMSYAIIAATIPCLRPFMTALSTNYGAPAQIKGSPSAAGTKRSGNDFSLNSLSKTSRLGHEEKGKSVTAPTTRWDQSEHHASVTSGDQRSMESHESKQMIISKNTEWAVEYEGPNRNT